MPRTWYIYCLLDWRAHPFYIGMGRGRRVRNHAEPAYIAKERNRIKKSITERTIAALGELPSIIIRDRISRDEACLLERTFISAIGRRDLNTGPLANMSPGGTGGDFGDSIRRAKASWTPEKRFLIGQAHGKAMRAWWDRLTPAEQQHQLTKRATAGQEALRILREANPEYDILRGKHISEGFARRTPEQKEQTKDKIAISLPTQRRSQIVSDYWSGLSPEQRSQRQKGSSTSEERSARGRLAASKRDPIERSNQVREQQANLTLEQKERRSARAKKLATETKWITNGTTLRRLPIGSPLPKGWKFGNKLSKVKKDQLELPLQRANDDPE
jgi:hypothetical protein